MKSYPSISIITPLYTSDRTVFQQMLASVALQDYPKDRVEHIFIDGGANAATLRLAKKSGGRILSHPELENSAQARAAIGIQHARHDLILFLETDNILIGNSWLKEMAKPFQQDKTMVCTFSAYNAPLPRMSAVGRYFSYIGANDVLLCYLRKSEKMAVDQTRYHIGSNHRHQDGYILVTFNTRSLPTLGDNGHMARKKFLLDVIGDPLDFRHVDAFMNMTKNGHTQYAVVDNAVVHVSEGNIIDLLSRRIRLKKIYYDRNRGVRSYHVFDMRSPRDVFRVGVFILCALTVVQPLLRSIKGFLYNYDPAWFLHVPVTLLTVIFYAYSEIRFVVARKIFL